MICFEVPQLPFELFWMIVGAVALLVAEMAFLGMIFQMPFKAFAAMDASSKRKVKS